MHIFITRSTKAVLLFIALLLLLCAITACKSTSSTDALLTDGTDSDPEIPEMFGEESPMLQNGDEGSVVSGGTSLDSSASITSTEEPEILFTVMTEEVVKGLQDGSTKPVQFTEVWGYVLANYESAYDASYPITDVAYFGAGINSYGELSGVPDRNKLKNFPCRVHLVVADSGASLSHMVLSTELPMRKKFLEKLVEAAKDYDGVQIDFETIPSRDNDNFLTFLSDLKSKLGNKMLSVAIPARTRTISGDAFNYKSIEKIVDRIVIMAYDEHWSGSVSGPVASLAWCGKIADYAKSVIPEEKLIMGLPLYGRAWSDDDSEGAYRMSTIEKMINTNTADSVTRVNGNASIHYQVTANIALYFEDYKSLFDKLSQYNQKGVKSVAFWRLGLEYPSMWNLMTSTGE